MPDEQTQEPQSPLTETPESTPEPAPAEESPNIFDLPEEDDMPSEADDKEAPAADDGADADEKPTKPADDASRETKKADGKPAEPKTSAEIPAKTDEIDPDVMAAAKAAGLTEHEIKRIGSSAGVESLLTRMVQKGVLEHYPQPKPAAQPEPAKPAEKPKESDSDEDPLKGLEEYDEGLAKIVRGMHEAHKREVEALKGKLAEYDQEKNTQALKAEIGWFDEQIASLGSEFEEVLGKGSSFELDPKSDAYKNREELLTELRLRSQMYAKTGQRPDGPKVFRRAVNAVFGDRIFKGAEEKARDKINTAIEEAKKRTTGRPGAHREPVKHGIDEAADYLEKKWGHGDPADKDTADDLSDAFLPAGGG